MNLNRSLASLDLNLLAVLAAILEEVSVTKAAQKMHVSQPAMSQSLKRLRILLDDQIVTRSPKGTVLTQRAAGLVPVVRELMLQIQGVFFNGESFDPATATRHFTIIATDYTELVLLPALSRRLAAEAPNIKLQIIPSAARIPDQELANGNIDLAIGFFPEYPTDFYQRKLFADEFVTVVRGDHPLVKTGIDLDSFADAKHVLVAPWGDTIGIVDEMLAKQKLKREIVRWVPHFQSAPLMIIDSDFITTLPQRVANLFLDPLGLVKFPTPVSIPGFSIFTFWHERTHREPAGIWLRQMILEVSQNL